MHGSYAETKAGGPPLKNIFKKIYLPQGICLTCCFFDMYAIKKLNDKDLIKIIERFKSVIINIKAFALHPLVIKAFALLAEEAFALLVIKARGG
jgi:hypothetical protein